MNDARMDANSPGIFYAPKIILKKFLQTLDSIKKDTVSLSIERTKRTHQHPRS